MLSATREVKRAGSIRVDFMERVAIEEGLRCREIFLNSAREGERGIPCSENNVPNCQGLGN